MEEHTEVERTYTPGDDSEVPDLRGLDGVARVGGPQTTLLRATYLDTRDLALLRGGVTLRRRTGGEDEGWHAKLPAGTARRELRLPLTDDERPPAALAEAVRGWSRGAALEEVARLETRRTE